MRAGLQFQGRLPTVRPVPLYVFPVDKTLYPGDTTSCDENHSSNTLGPKGDTRF